MQGYEQVRRQYELNTNPSPHYSGTPSLRWDAHLHCTHAVLYKCRECAVFLVPFPKEEPMAKVKLNPIVEQLRGQIGELVFRQNLGKTVIGRKVDTSTHDPSASQLEVRERFRQAALYGRMALANQAARNYMKTPLPRKASLSSRWSWPTFSTLP